MVGKQYAGTKTEKVRVVGKIKFQNSKSHYKSKTYSQQIMVEENNSTVLREERNRNSDNGIRRRPNICKTNIRVIAKTKTSTRKQYIRWNFKRS